MLSFDNFINNFTIFMGWIVALFIGWIHLQKTREDNKLLKKEEIRDAIEINAFKEINKAVSEFSSLISGISVTYLTLKSKLELHIEFAQICKFNKHEIYSQLRKEETELYSGTANFVIAIEANEIAVIEFDYYRKYIQHRVDDIHEAVTEFIDYFQKTSISILITKVGHDEFNGKCDEIYEQFVNIQSYLFDYRIELMNSKLGKVFDKRVPERRPRDPRYKTLKELAIKEEVEKESKERELKCSKFE